MQPIITPDQSARLDEAAADPVPVLMERAGLAVALNAIRMGAGYGRRVVVLAGPGNNGGDGYVAARHLARRGAAVRVHAVAPPRDPSSAAGRARQAALAAGVRMGELGEPEPADVVIDALFGAGFHGDLPEAAKPWTEVTAPVLAVDVPSGLDAASGEAPGTAFTAARTVTFEYRKVGHVLGAGPDRCGEIVVAPIGLPRYEDGFPAGAGPALLWCEETDAPRPGRARTAHKWSSGAVLVVGGSPGITGAPLLAAGAALHFGAGASAVCCPGNLAAVYEGTTPEIMTVAAGDGDRFAPGDAGAVLAAAGRYDVLALGPGLGRDAAGFVAAILRRWDRPLIVDADGLNALPGPAEVARRTAATVLTPHPGEFRRISGSEAGPEAASAYAAGADAVVVLKGNPTIVTGPIPWVVASGGPELATIGTGDVLTGMIAALTARGLAAGDAARSGAYWHGRAGAALAARTTVTADGLVDEVGRWAW